MQSGGAFFKGALAAKLQRTFDEGQHFRSSCEWSFFSVSFGLVGFFMQRAPFIQRRNKRCSRLGAELFRQFIESDLSEVSPLWIKHRLEKWRVDGNVLSKNYVRAPAVARASHWTNFSIVLNLARLGE